MVDKKKILRGVEIHGEADILGKIDVRGTGPSLFTHGVNFDTIHVGGNSVFQSDVTLSSPNPTQPNLIVEGIIENDQFFALNRGGTNPITVNNNAGIIIPGPPNRYYINRSGLAIGNVSSATDFSDENTWGEWFSGSGTGTTCVVDFDVNTTSNVWRGTNSTIRRWDQSNTGFTWSLSVQNPRIIQICGFPLDTGIPISFTPGGNLTLNALTLDGVTITPATPGMTGITITISYEMQVVNPTLVEGVNKTFLVEAELEINEESFTSQMMLTYTAPIATLSISGSSLFDAGITTVNITRGFNGNPTSVTRSAPTGWTFGNGTFPSNVTIGGAGFTRSDFDPNDPSNRQITENYEFENATNDLDTLPISRIATLNPVFTFPIYFGNTDSVSGLSNAEVQTFSTVAASTSDNQLPRQFSFSSTDASLNQNVILIRTAFSQGRELAVTMSDPTNNPQPFTTVGRSRTINIGRIAGDLESYDVYNVVENQPAVQNPVPAFVRYL